MSILNFSKDLQVRIFGENELVKVATHQISNSGELENLRMLLYKKGNCAGILKLLFYPTGSNVAMAISAEVDAADITDDFLGWVRFDFNSNISSGTYDIYCEISDYARDGETKYISLVYDFPVPIYDNDEPEFYKHPIALQDFVRI